MNMISPHVPIRIHLADGSGFVEIDPIDYAIGKTGNLGINEAGKTYAAGFMAEQLMKRGIPIVVITPSPGSPWRYLKIPKPGKEGFPVVIVGENADLPLDPERVGEIMLAAMQERISIVFDLHSSKLSETARRKITTAIVDTMYWKNQNYGLRHCFLEEAANYAPQNLHDKVTYGAVERFTREGGNAKVGVTLLNPRAESVNKNLLELCSSLFLFQQTGKNSVGNLKKFFDQIDTSNRNEIIKSFPRLIKGRAWYWKATTAIPTEVQFPEKDTEHPNRRALAMDADIPLDKAVDVTSFVERMNKALKKTAAASVKENLTPAKKTYDQGVHSDTLTNRDLVALQQENEKLRTDNAHLSEKAETIKSQNIDLSRQISAVEGKLDVVREMLRPDYDRLKSIFEEVGERVEGNGRITDRSKYEVWFPKLTGKQRQMLEILIERKKVTLHQMRVLLGMSDSGTFGDYHRGLAKLGLARLDNGTLYLEEIE